MSRPGVDLSDPMAHVLVDESGCWRWQRAVNKVTGYGTLGARYAHRVYYELHVGPIPAGLTIDHLCRVRDCVNPEHLEAVTIRENILRSENPAARNARRTHCPEGHPFDDENTGRINTRRRSESFRICRECNRAKQRAEYQRRKATGTVPPSQTSEARKARRDARKAVAS